MCAPTCWWSLWWFRTYRKVKIKVGSNSSKYFIPLCIEGQWESVCGGAFTHARVYPYIFCSRHQTLESNVPSSDIATPAPTSPPTCPCHTADSQPWLHTEKYIIYCMCPFQRFSLVWFGQGPGISIFRRVPGYSWSWKLLGRAVQQVRLKLEFVIEEVVWSWTCEVYKYHLGGFREKKRLWVIGSELNMSLSTFPPEISLKWECVINPQDTQNREEKATDKRHQQSSGKRNANWRTEADFMDLEKAKA